MSLPKERGQRINSSFRGQRRQRGWLRGPRNRDIVAAKAGLAGGLLRSRRPKTMLVVRPSSKTCLMKQYTAGGPGVDWFLMLLYKAQSIAACLQVRTVRLSLPHAGCSLLFPGSGLTPRHVTRHHSAGFQSRQVGTLSFFSSPTFRQSSRAVVDIADIFYSIMTERYVGWTPIELRYTQNGGAKGSEDATSR
jgi:hypothetical protein